MNREINATLCFLVMGCTAIGCDSQKNSQEITTDTGTSDSDSSSAVCADDSKIYEDVCVEICMGKKSQEECEAVDLPLPSALEYSYTSHACIWYKAIETTIDDDGTCSFGEERHVCGYAIWGDIWCTGSGMVCEGDEYPDMNKAASYFEEDGRIFLTNHQCAVYRSDVYNECAWTRGEETYYLKRGVRECDCACSPVPSRQSTCERSLVSEGEPITTSHNYKPQLHNYKPSKTTTRTTTSTTPTICPYDLSQRCRSPCGGTVFDIV